MTVLREKMEEGQILPFCAVSEKANLVNYLLPLA
jgi:hypothetical protein